VRFNDGGQGAADLGRGEVVGELATEGYHGQQVEDAAAVGEAAADRGVGAFGGDLTFLDGGVAPGAGEDLRLVIIPARVFLTDGLDDVEEAWGG
jgi:hypothetical protein